MDAMGLTKRQRDTMRFLQKFIDKKGYAPSYDEIGAAIGQKSRSGVYRLIHGLEERGYIELPERQLARALRIIVRVAE